VSHRFSSRLLIDSIAENISDIFNMCSGYVNFTGDFRKTESWSTNIDRRACPPSAWWI